MVDIELGLLRTLLADALRCFTVAPRATQPVHGNDSASSQRIASSSSPCSAPAAGNLTRTRQCEFLSCPPRAAACNPQRPG
eukprot:scaffold12772_cov126-Isochrysis_galbana.AAC.5